MNGHELSAYERNPRSRSLPSAQRVAFSAKQITAEWVSSQPVVSARERCCRLNCGLQAAADFLAFCWAADISSAQGHGPANQAATPVVCVVCLPHRAEWIACTHSIDAQVKIGRHLRSGSRRFFHYVHAQKAERMEHLANVANSAARRFVCQETY
jgi:hypothetical protein